MNLTCVHALNLSANWASAVATVDLAEQAKDVHYAAACEQAGLAWTPAVIDTFGFVNVNLGCKTEFYRTPVRGSHGGACVPA